MTQFLKMALDKPGNEYAESHAAFLQATVGGTPDAQLYNPICFCFFCSSYMRSCGHIQIFLDSILASAAFC
jgi:hypothetical protein